MSDRDWNDISEPEFDALLQDSVPELPPEGVVREVTPWRTAMERVIFGLAFTALTLNFLNLNYIFPAIGLVLTVLGFRALRRENGWFRAGLVITVLQTTYFFFNLILNATVYRSVLSDSPVLTVLSIASLGLTFLLCICLWGAFRAVQKKAGLPPHAGGAGALVVWYAVLCGLALVKYQGLIIALAVIVAYICILRSLFKLSKELDEAGYTVEAAPVRLSDGILAVGMFTILVVGIVCGYLFFDRYPMDWQPIQTAHAADAAEIKMQLIDLGFPEDVLADLADEDIRACAGASRVVMEERDFPVNEGRQVTTHVGNHYQTHTEYDVKELRITGIAVQVPGDRENWRIIQHFRWVVDPGFPGTESIQLWPAYKTDGWMPDGDVTGRVLYNKDGQTYVAPYYSLGSQTYSYDSIFWGQQTSTDVFAAFSMPKDGENHRGYITYEIKKSRDTVTIVDAWINYTHQRSKLQYPVLTAQENRMRGSWNLGNSPFVLVQDALQFYPWEGEIEVFGADN